MTHTLENFINDIHNDLGVSEKETKSFVNLLIFKDYELGKHTFNDLLNDICRDVVGWCSNFPISVQAYNTKRKKTAIFLKALRNDKITSKYVGSDNSVKLEYLFGNYFDALKTSSRESKSDERDDKSYSDDMVYISQLEERVETLKGICIELIEDFHMEAKNMKKMLISYVENI